MPTKQQSAKRRRAGTPKPNLGQEEAELERTGKEKMSHMEKNKAGNTAQRATHQRWHKIATKTFRVVFRSPSSMLNANPGRTATHGR